MGLLEGKVGIVTGGGSGIGRATAIRMAREGASVVVADINPTGAGETVQLIVDAGGSAVAHQADIASEPSVKSMVGAAIENFGRLDLLHNNAANVFVVPNDLDVLTTDLETWDATFATNVRGTFLCCKHALPHLLAASPLLPASRFLGAA